jgi:hypothetical protein
MFHQEGGNAIAKQACPEAKGSNPSTALTLVWAHDPIQGMFQSLASLTIKTRQIFKT